MVRRPALIEKTGRRAARTGTFPEANVDAASADTGLSQVDSPKKESGLAGGALAAAVVVPVLALLAVIIAYVVWSRKRSKSDTRRWSNYGAPTFTPFDRD